MVERRPFIDEQVYFDEESQIEDEDPKIARAIRHGFIKKVYGIVAAQLLLSTIVGAYFTFYESARDWIVTSGTPLLFLSAIMALILSLMVVCVPSVAEKYPTNYIILTFFTLFESIALGGLCAVVAKQTGGGQIVLEALLCTAVIVVGLTFFAFQTKYDFISWAGGLLVVLLALMMFGLIRLFFPRSPIVEAIYAAAMALVFAVYILIDTQMIIGRGKIKMSEDQYIIAALSLYMDIIQLFVYILKFLQEINRGND